MPYSKSFKYSAGQHSQLPISAFIITLNEEDNIKSCLESVSFCKEIIVVDSGSTDRTRQIASEMGATVYSHEFTGYTDQKQWALEQCTNDWVLSIDADERVTEDLYEFLQELDLKNTEFAGFEVRRLYWFMGNWLKNAGLYPDYKLRIFQRDKGKFVGENIHEVVYLEGKVKKLPFDLLHYPWKNIKDYFLKQINYAERVANNKYKAGKTVSLVSIVCKALFTFLHRYFIRFGFLDGVPGLIVSAGAMIGTAYKYFRLWELNRLNSTKCYFPKNKLLCFVLQPVQFIYKFVVQTRLELFAKGHSKTNKLPGTVISVGNLTVGGSGKTPFTIWLANALSQLGLEHIAILTRGYKSKGQNIRVVKPDSGSLEVGDEALLMSQQLISENIKVVVSPNRFESGQFAIQNFNSELFILDDGFQHVQLERDLNLCLVDCSDPNSLLTLPLGSLREPFEQIKRATHVVLTRAENNVLLKNKILNKINILCPQTPIFELRESINQFTYGLSKHAEYPQGKRVLAFCGLGNPAQFYEALRATGLKVQQTVTFADHHKYSEEDLLRLKNLAIDAEADFLVTTSKDAVKIVELGECANLLVAHNQIQGLVSLNESQIPDLDNQLRNLLGSDIFNNLTPNRAEKIG